MQSSATRIFGVVRSAAAIWKTCGAWNLKSMQPRMMRQKENLLIASKRWPPRIGPMERSSLSPMVSWRGWDWCLKPVPLRRRVALSSFTFRPAALRRLPASIAARFRPARRQRARCRRVPRQRVRFHPEMLRPPRSCRALFRPAPFDPPSCRRTKPSLLRRTLKPPLQPPWHFQPQSVLLQWPKSHRHHLDQSSPRGRTRQR